MDEMRAFAFGFTVAAAFGPIALLLVHAGLSRGFARAVPAAAGVAAADFLYSLVAFAAGSGVAAALHSERLMFAVGSSCVLLALGAWMIVRSLAQDPESPARRAPRRSAGFGATFLLTLANPLTIVLFAGFSGQLPLSAGLGKALYFSLLIGLGSLPVQLGYAFLGSALRQFVPNAPLARATRAASGTGVLLFGVYGILRALYGF